MNELLVKNTEGSDFSQEALKEFNGKLDHAMTGSGDLGNEIERIFPGYLGRIFTVFYHGFLNAELDTEEKAAAWKELIQKLDEAGEVDYPENIKKIIDELYDGVERERMGFRETDGLGPNGSSSDLEPEDRLKEADEEYTADPDREKKAQGYYILQDFIRNNLIGFRELGVYLEIINKEQ